MSPIERAANILGSQAALAGALGVTNMAVVHWKRRGIPATRVLAIERATGGQVSRHELRPDLYPVEVSVAERAAPAAETTQTMTDLAMSEPILVPESARQGAA